MGLMQIAEPGLSAAPHEERLAVGIDLGTTNSLVASVVSGAAEVIRDDEGRALLPSIVRYLADGTVHTGWQAAVEQADDPLNTISSAKRLIGRGLKDIAGNITLPYRFVPGEGMVKIETAAMAFFQPASIATGSSLNCSGTPSSTKDVICMIKNQT